MSEMIKLSASEKKNFLSLVRQTIKFYLEKRKVPDLKDFDITLPTVAEEQTGVFVTLNKRGELRGCIGYVQGYKPLKEAIIDNAINAASKDPRFPQVRKEELDEIDIEISILSPLKEIKDTGEIETGVHGIIISKGFNSGLLLPQVATEYGWSREEFLNYTCLKAGLPKNAWKEGSKIEIFSAVVFGEKN